MNGAISLSKRERRYQFFYLLGMLLVVLLVSGFVFLRKFQSPFTQTDVMDIQLLAQKNKFSEQQKIVELLLKNTFTKISILKVEKPQPFVENDIKSSINDLANYFQSNEVFDTRKNDYLQIAKFYRMYFEDKKIAAKKTENIKLFEQQFEECSIGFKEKEQQLAQKKNAIIARNR